MNETDMKIIDRAVEMKDYLSKKHGIVVGDIAGLIQAAALLSSLEEVKKEGVNVY